MPLRRLMWLVVFALAGCDGTPKAPALRDEPVYDNPKEGLRFLSPSGWSQQARSDPPSGETDKEQLLVRYQGFLGEKAALLELTRADLPEGSDILARLKEPSHSLRETWQQAGAPESVTVGGRPATRYALTQKKMTKEVTVIRRGNRTFFFIGVFDTADDKTRLAIRKVVTDVTWTQ